MLPGCSVRRTWAVAALTTTAVAACGGATHTATHGHHRRAGAGGPQTSGLSGSSDQGVAVGGADGTATIAVGVSAASLPHGWISCPASGAQDAGAAAPQAGGCGFVRATEVQVQELLHNEGSTVFNTPESIGVSYGNAPQRLLNCTAQHDGPTIVCADDGVPWVIVFRPPGQ